MPTRLLFSRIPRHIRFTPGEVGFLTAWLFFYWMGEALLSAPAKFHDGTLWKAGFREE